MDTDEYSEEYPREVLGYLERGIMVTSEKAGLIHYVEPEEEMRLLERGAGEHQAVWHLEWYDRQTERLAGDEELQGLADANVRRVLDRPASDDLDGMFELNAGLSERLIGVVEIKTSFDFDRYDYFLGKVSKALP
ncbi:hypothetical protein MPL3365_70280 [Mesorhizobium plurifarium]|uniref:DUF7683 domain-containing protein n=2 Tax=Mesorhizobium TaxID=68287 RepID=A0A090GH24_MESPL|nr:hypothetical protein MPL3365_70280 [Mesorhizobium plurifarium]